MQQQYTEDHPHTQDCGCTFTPTSLTVHAVIKDNLEQWDTIDDDTVLRVKQAFVALIPALGPVDTLKMAMGKDPRGTGFHAIFADRPFREVTISNNKEKIWLLE